MQLPICGGGVEGLRQLVSQMANTCGGKTGENTRIHGATCELLASSVAKICYLSAEQVSVNCDLSCCMSGSNSLCFSSLFKLCLSVLGESILGPLCGVPLRLEMLVAHPTPFLIRGTLSSWEVPSWCSTMTAWGAGWHRQNRVVFFLCNYSQGVFVVVVPQRF